MSRPRLLDRIDQMDTSWLESVLRQAGYASDVARFSTRPVGAGNVSDTVRIDLDYAADGSGAPGSVIAKFKPSDEAIHQHGLGSGAYHREIGAYRAITRRAACRIPRLFWVAGDKTNINLVIEDLTETAEPGDQVAGASVERARAVMTELARLHSSFAPLDEASAPDWPIRMPAAADYWADTTRQGARTALARYRDRLSSQHLELIAAAGANVRQWYLLPQIRLSLSHGDPRVDNVLFEQRNGEEGAVLIDWQVTGLRNPMYDVGYFLSGSVAPAQRQAHERELIQHYLAVYAERAGGYGLDEALDDYRVQLLSGLMITTAAIAVLPDNDTVNALICTLLERNCAAAAHWDSFGAFAALPGSA